MPKALPVVDIRQPGGCAPLALRVLEPAEALAVALCRVLDPRCC